MKALNKFISFVLTTLLLGIRPFLGPATCCYTVSCTQYARWQLKTEPAHKAIWAIFKRLISCSPFAKPKD